MKKTLIYAVAVLFGAGFMAACSSNDNKECPNCNNEENAAEQVEEALQDGQPVAVDVENAEVIDQPNGAQEVQTEVTMTPETAN